MPSQMLLLHRLTAPSTIRTRKGRAGAATTWEATTWDRQRKRTTKTCGRRTTQETNASPDRQRKGSTKTCGRRETQETNASPDRHRKGRTKTCGRRTTQETNASP